jgi:hypothetical protein
MIVAGIRGVVIVVTVVTVVAAGVAAICIVIGRIIAIVISIVMIIVIVAGIRGVVIVSGGWRRGRLLANHSCSEAQGMEQRLAICSVMSQPGMERYPCGILRSHGFSCGMKSPAVRKVCTGGR